MIHYQGLWGGDKEKAEAKENELVSLGGGLHAFAQGLQAAITGDEAEALLQLRAAVENAPDNPDYHIALIRQLIEQEAWQEAQTQLETSMALHAGYQLLIYQYVRYHVLLQESVPSDVHDIIAQLIENNDSAPARLLPESIYLLRARIRQLEGDREGAAADYRYVREHAPKLIDEMEFEDYEREL